MEPFKFDEEHAAKCKKLKKLIDEWLADDFGYYMRFISGCYVQSMIGKGAFGDSTLRIQFGDTSMLIELCIRRERIGFIIADMYVRYASDMQGYEQGCPDAWEYFYKCLNILIRDLPVDLVSPHCLIINESWFEAIVKHMDHLNLHCIDERDMPDLTRLLKKHNKKINTKFLKICMSYGFYQNGEASSDPGSKEVPAFGEISSGPMIEEISDDIESKETFVTPEIKEYHNYGHISDFFQQIERCDTISIHTNVPNIMSILIQHLPSTVDKCYVGSAYSETGTDRTIEIRSKQTLYLCCLKLASEDHPLMDSRLIDYIYKFME